MSWPANNTDVSERLAQTGREELQGTKFILYNLMSKVQNGRLYV